MAAEEKQISKFNSSLKRIMKDLKELNVDPLENASLSPLEDGADIFELHCNIIVPYGPYEGLTIHFILKLNEYFPVSSPAGFMPDDYPFTSAEHEHIHGNGICNDFLSNYKEWFDGLDNDRIRAGVGWSPGITLKSLLLAMCHFFAITDRLTPSEEKLKEIRKNVNIYKCTKCNHTNENPFPPIFLLKSVSNSPNNSSTPKETQARSMLVCNISKESYLDDPDNMVLGYPIHLARDYRDRLWTTLIPELMSYDQYVLQIQEKGIEKLEKFNEIRLQTAGGAAFTHWLPIFLNENHYNKNTQYIYNTLSVLSNGIEGTKENDFQPFMILRVLPCLMNKMVVAMMKKELHESHTSIYAYCHYLALLFHMLDMYPFLNGEMNSKIRDFLGSYKGRHKDRVPELGEFLIWLCISDKYDYYDRDIQRIYLSEKFARQVLWTIKAGSKKLIFEKDIDKRLEGTFKANEVSNKLLVFNLMASKFFIFKGVKQKLNDNYGMPPVEVVESFQSVIKKIKSIDNYDTLLKAISYDRVLDSKQKLIYFLNDARNISEYQRYTSLFKRRNENFMNKDKYIISLNVRKTKKKIQKKEEKTRVENKTNKFSILTNE